MATDRNGIQAERAPLLLVFGDLAPRVASLVRVRPLLIARLIVAPREAVHSIGAYLHLASAAGGPDAEVAALIDETDPRDLLSAALPNCPSRLYRALDRAGDRVRGRPFYERLGDICRGPFADALLDGGAIDDARLTYFEKLVKMDPALVGMRSAIGENSYLAEAADCLVALLRAHHALNEDEFRLPGKSGMRALTRRLRTALGRIQAPDPGFAAPPPFRLVRSSAELQMIGKRFRNCVRLPDWNAARYHVQLVQGSTVFLVADEPPVLASLNRVAAGVWHLEQIAGQKNAPPPAGTRAALIRDLSAAGQRVVTADPQSSLGRLVQEDRRRVDRQQDDLDDDDADEIAA